MIRPQVFSRFRALNLLHTQVGCAESDSATRTTPFAQVDASEPDWGTIFALARVMIALHLVARAKWKQPILKDRDACCLLWNKLRSQFPKVLGCVLMPNHVHLLIAPDQSRNCIWRMGVALRAWTRESYPGQTCWETIPKAEAIPDSKYFQRTVRYIHLNPCRAGLARDPLEWEWSTDRDLHGCVIPCWLDMPQLARLMNTHQSKLPTSLHTYFSRDPSVAIAGTPPPQSTGDGSQIIPLRRLIQTASMVLRVPYSDSCSRKPARNLALHLASHFGVGSKSELLHLLKISRFGASVALRQKIDPALLTAAQRLIAEPRYWSLCRESTP